MTFEDFLDHFTQYDIRFAIELKSGGIEKAVIDMIKKFHIEGRTTITSFKYEYIKAVKEIDPEMRVGWLVHGDGCDKIEQLLAIGGEEMAPQAKEMTKESVEQLRAAGLGVRAWGLSSQELMKKMCGLNVDGMTVNFPDRLAIYLSYR